jgi:hypothetical protein
VQATRGFALLSPVLAGSSSRVRFFNHLSARPWKVECTPEQTLL